VNKVTVALLAAAVFDHVDFKEAGWQIAPVSNVRTGMRGSVLRGHQRYSKRLTRLAITHNFSPILLTYAQLG
jgi:hypothetical protein